MGSDILIDSIMSDDSIKPHLIMSQTFSVYNNNWSSHKTVTIIKRLYQTLVKSGLNCSFYRTNFDLWWDGIVTKKYYGIHIFRYSSHKHTPNTPHNFTNLQFPFFFDFGFNYCFLFYVKIQLNWILNFLLVCCNFTTEVSFHGINFVPQKDTCCLIHNTEPCVMYET